MYSYSTELAHHGIKGMKWGIRRFQNKDGSLTKAGRKRYGSDSGSNKKADPKASTAKASTSGKKSLGEMSDDELRSAITRLQLEQQYRSLKPEKVSAGKKFFNDAVMPAVSEASKNLLKDYMTKVGKQMLGLNESKDSEDSLKALKNEFDKLELKNKIKNLKSLNDPDSLQSLNDKKQRLELEKQIKKLEKGDDTDTDSLKKLIEDIRTRNEYDDLTNPDSDANLAKIAKRLKNEDTIKKYTEGTNNDSNSKSKKDEDEDEDEDD